MTEDKDLVLEWQLFYPTIPTSYIEHITTEYLYAVFKIGYNKGYTKGMADATRVESPQEEIVSGR